MIALEQNENILSIQDINDLNNLMLSRGVPIEKDDTGYNRPDYLICDKFKDTLNPTQALIVLKCLKKYTSRQLKDKIEKTKLEKTIKYYEQFEKDLNKMISIEKSSNSITIYPSSSNNLFYDFFYNKKPTSINNTGKSFTFSLLDIIEVLEEFKQFGGIVDEEIILLKQFLNTKKDEIKKLQKQRDLEIEQKNKVSILNSTSEYIEISFEYNYDLIQDIKTLKYRKYNSENKSWIISTLEIKELINILDKYKLVYSEIEDYYNNSKEKIDNIKLKIDIIKQSEKYVTLSFQYDKDLIDAIKSLTDRKYNSENRSWKISIKELDILCDKIDKEIYDISNLLSICEKVEEKCIELIDTPVELMDVSNIDPIPFEHQIESANFLLENKKAILALEMGGGKTKSSILSAYSINGKKLVVCPSSLKYNWEKEIRMIDMNNNIFIIDNWKLVPDAIDSNDWLIINYDILNKPMNKLLALDFTVLIVDEAHYCKAVNNSGKPTSDRAKAVNKLSSNIEYGFYLTGTPIPNRTKDIFNLLKFCDSPLAKNFFQFGCRYCDGKHNGYGWDFNGSSNQEELYEALKSVMLRKRKDEMLELPPKIRTFIPTIINTRGYTEKLNEYMDARKYLNNNEKAKHLVYLNAMRMIIAEEKIPYTINTIDNLLEQNKPVVVFTCCQIVIDSLMEKYKDNIVKITGEDSSKNRQKAVEDFQDGKIKIIACNIEAGGVGITLTNAANLIFNDFSWLPSDHSQAEDRIHRIGQNKKCNIYYMYAKNIEIDVKMASMLEEKLKNISVIIDNKEDDFIENVINIFNKVS